MSVAEIDSEAKENVVETDPQLGPSNYCVIIMEQPPLSRFGEKLPEWIVTATLTLRDPVLGKEDVLAHLPSVVVGPLHRKRQVVAVAKYLAGVVKWSFLFESEAGRAKAKVWLQPGVASITDAGIFAVKDGPELGAIHARQDRR